MRSALLFLALAAAACAHPTLHATRMSVDVADEIAAGNVMLVDIRPAREREADGAPRPSVHAEFLSADVHSTRFADEVLRLGNGSRDSPVALICREGVMSRRAATYLVRNGFTNVTSISDGYRGGTDGGGWRWWGLPTEGKP